MCPPVVRDEETLACGLVSGGSLTNSYVHDWHGSLHSKKAGVGYRQGVVRGRLHLMFGSLCHLWRWRGKRTNITDLIRVHSL